MFELTSDQKRLIAEGDARAKTEYLSAAPSISSASVKNTEIYRSITNRMKRRVETTFQGKEIFANLIILFHLIKDTLVLIFLND